MGAEYGIAHQVNPLDMPENLWTALTWSRSYRMGLAQAEQDQRDGKISLINIDAEE